MNVLDKVLTLTLNNQWIPCGQRSIREAVVCLCSESNGEKPALALDMEMGVDNTITYVNPVDWDEWITLPVREGDLYISTSSGKIRAPLVIICRHYNKVPLTRPRLSVGNIWVRDEGMCQYTGRKLPRAALNVDHIIPRSRGGRDEWTNMVLADKKLNSIKGNKLNDEAGLRLIREPKAPKATPLSLSITEARHPSWEPFLIKR